MNSKDRDIKKLKDYARSLGLKVLSRPYNKFTGAAECDDYNKTITLFGNPSKKQIILSLLHELGHYLDFLKNGNTKKICEAFRLLNRGPMIGTRHDVSKKYRKTILQVEKNGIKYMTRIHKELKLEISVEHVKIQQKLDLFDYQFFYKEARFPTLMELPK